MLGSNSARSAPKVGLVGGQSARRRRVKWKRILRLVRRYVSRCRQENMRESSTTERIGVTT